MNEFYVGYLPKAPSGIARRIWWIVSALFLVVATGAIIFARAQRSYSPSAFEFGKERTFDGVVDLHPYPALLVPRPGIAVGQEPFSRYTLVAAGKHGANDQLSAFAGKTVRLRGTLIYRDDQTMVELVSGSVSVLPEQIHTQETVQDLGTFTLTGEIVDSKCNFGVMNPGNGKVHRDCAVRCLSGGIPPAFVTNDFNGQRATLLLTAPNGEPLPKEAFLKRVAQPVSISGNVTQRGETLLLGVKPDTITPLP
jgi:hypothetical protein